jgi:uncharacterized protein (DUF1015 family)
VPRFTPFRAIRYADGTDLAAVTAPPYDVLSDADLDALEERDPHNIVHVDVPRERDGDGRYEAAAARLRSWLAEGVLVEDPERALYLYRVDFTDAAGTRQGTVGVLGGLEVQEHDARADVLPHERTTPKATTDRLDLTRATGANLSPVWGLSLAEGLFELLAPAATPLGEVTVDGVRHRLERIDDADRRRAIAAVVAGAPVVIADGHHRYDVARTYRREQPPGPAEETLCFVAELVDHQLHVQPIHRLLDVDAADLGATLADRFELEPFGEVTSDIVERLVQAGGLALVDRDGQATLLRPLDGAFEGVPDLDSARLEAALGSRAAGLRYQHGVAEVLDALDHGHARSAVLLRPVSVEAIRAMAGARGLMPPKSTFFWPKLRTGLVIRRASGSPSETSK